MSEMKVQRIDGAELRRLAEDQHREIIGTAHLPGTGEDPLKLLHELQVHQIELEMQIVKLVQERTEREKMEARLGKYSELYDFAQGGYFNLDHGGIIRAVNLTGTGFLGIARSLLIGRRLDRFISDETRPVFRDFLDKVFASETKETCEVVLQKERHSPLVVQIEAVLSESREGCRAVVIDISERKMAEEQIRQKKRQLEELNRTLRQRVKTEVANNREKDIILIQQNRQAATGETLEHIVHQWKQPINTIGLMVQFLQSCYAKGKPTADFVRETTDKMMDLLDHMAETADVFRDYYKPEKEKRVFGIRSSVQEALSFIEPAFRYQNITVEIDADPELAAHGYPKEFAQVLLIILTNARDAFKERRTEKSRLTIKAFAEGRRAVVTVTDNAGGIPERAIGKLFDLYFSTKEATGGTGIGLYMAKSIIEKNMGGRLTVRNTGYGAEFRIEV